MELLLIQSPFFRKDMGLLHSLFRLNRYNMFTDIAKTRPKPKYNHRYF